MAGLFLFELSLPLLLLRLTLICGFLAQTSASTSVFPTTVEVDFVFPRNESYTPTSQMMPIVFAIQNPQASVSLGFILSWTLFRTGEDTIASGSIDLSKTNLSNASNPYFLVTSTTALTNTQAGKFSLLWNSYTVNCSLKTEHLSVIVGSNKTIFTIQKGAPPPSLDSLKAPSMKGDECLTPGLTYNITETRSVGLGRGGLDRASVPETCAVLAEPDQPANPCAATVNSDSAASITASLCSSSRPIITGCPATTSQTSKSMAIRSSLNFRSGWMGLGLIGATAAVASCTASIFLFFLAGRKGG